MTTVTIIRRHAQVPQVPEVLNIKDWTSVGYGARHARETQRPHFVAETIVCQCPSQMARKILERANDRKTIVSENILSTETHCYPSLVGGRFPPTAFSIFIAAQLTLWIGNNFSWNWLLVS